MSIPPPSPAPNGALDERRLHAALRLFLTADRAARAAGELTAAADLASGLRRLAGDLARERRLDRVKGWLVRRSQPPMLSSEVPERALLMLAVHLGLGLDGEWLEDAFGLDREEVGRDLLLARVALIDQSIPACREYEWIIGRYRDRSMASDDRLRLLSHVTTCEVCRDALDRAQQADGSLLAEIDRQHEMLPERSGVTPAKRPRRAIGGMAVAVGGVAALMLLVVGLSVIGGLFSNSRPAVPLFVNEPSSAAPLDGWLLQVSTVGYLEGVNLTTGRKRGLDSGDGGNFSPLYRVSRTHIAAWRPSDGQRDDVLTIGPIGDQFRFRLTWNRRFVYWYPSGWLDDDTLLIVKSPEHIDGETEQQYIDRLTSASRLIAFDARSGAERVLMTGNIAAAFPSPDGTMLAIIRPVDRRWPGNTLELRPFDGQKVGESIVQIDHRVAADGVWLADSSRFVTTVITDESVSRQAATSDASLAERGIGGVALTAIDRNGQQHALVSAAIPETIIPMAASPDGRSVVYEVREERPRSEFPGIPDYAWRCYQLAISGGEPVLLASGESPERSFTPAWSPDGSTLVLPVARGFPLATEDRFEPPLIPNATTLLVFRPGWQPGREPEVIYSSGRDLYGWLAPGALALRAGSSSEGSRSLASVETPDADVKRLALDAQSVAASGSDYIVASERGSGIPLIWSVAGNRPRRLTDDITDLAWFNHGTAAIGVAASQDGHAGSRIVVTAADIASSTAYLDHQYFDPVNLGSSTEQRYARPLVSSAGTVVSFFVVDQRTGTVSLWLDTGAGPAKSVTEWTLPDERAIDPPIVASWVSSDTLLFAIPGDWHDGLPGTTVFMRLRLTADAPLVEELARIDASRGAEGIVLAEMMLSPDKSLLAYRLRQYDNASAAGVTEDTLHVAGTDNLNQAIELERGGSGDGLIWTTDGHHVIAGVRSRIALFSADGRDLEYLSPRGVHASYPLLIGDQVWFEAVDDNGARIWQVELE